jgi:hypothetical protein
MRRFLLSLALAGALAPSLASAQAYTPNANDYITVQDHALNNHRVVAQTYMQTQVAASASSLSANNAWTGTNTFGNTVTISTTKTLNDIGAFQLGSVTIANGTGTPSATLGGTGSPTASLTAQAGTAVMIFTLASASAATNLVITPGYTAATGWYCTASDTTTSTERLFQNTALSTTTATLTFFNAAGSATAPGATDVIVASCWSV